MLASRSRAFLGADTHTSRPSGSLAVLQPPPALGGGGPLAGYGLSGRWTRKSLSPGAARHAAHGTRRVAGWAGQCSDSLASPISWRSWVERDGSARDGSVKAPGSPHGSPEPSSTGGTMTICGCAGCTAGRPATTGCGGVGGGGGIGRSVGGGDAMLELSALLSLEWLGGADGLCWRSA